MRRLIVVLFVLLMGAVNVAAEDALAPIPELKSPVTDLVGVLTSEQVGVISDKLLAFQKEKGAQVAVLLTPSTQPESIEQYSIRVVDQWKLGRRKIDDGVLLLIATEDRTIRIEVAYGLEGALTDLASKRIIDEIIVPHLKMGDIFGGVDAGVDAVLRVVSGETLPAPQANYADGDPGVFIFPLVIIVAVGSLIRLALGPGRAAALCGTLATVAALFYLPVLLSLVAGFIVSVLVFFGAIGGSGGSRYSSSGGSSGSSYGGGGGSFGGGGASGRW